MYLFLDQDYILDFFFASLNDKADHNPSSNFVSSHTCVIFITFDSNGYYILDLLKYLENNPEFYVRPVFPHSMPPFISIFIYPKCNNFVCHVYCLCLNKSFQPLTLILVTPVANLFYVGGGGEVKVTPL